MMDKISIIIPVYNVGLYIRRCLDSVVNQTYKNLEILVIDDGSTDYSGRICDEYAQKDNRIKVFYKENGGVSSAKNVGLRNFLGDYIGFVDSDDWIEPGMYETLYKMIKENNVTLSVVNFSRDTGSCSVIEEAKEEIPNRVLTQNEMLLYISRRIQYAGFNFSCWNKLFDAAVVKDNNLFFDETLKMGEDAKFTTSVVLTDGCTGYLTKEPFYHYYQRHDSVMNSKHITNEVDMIRALKNIIELIEAKGLSAGTLWLKRDHCYFSSLLVEKAVERGDNRLFTVMLSEMQTYIGAYMEANKEYPERIERINRIFKLSISGI